MYFYVTSLKRHVIVQEMYTIILHNDQTYSYMLILMSKIMYKDNDDKKPRHNPK